MKQYLETFLRNFEYPEECAELLSECFDRIEAEQKKHALLRAALAAYAENRNVKFAVTEEAVKGLTEGLGFPEYTVWLLVWILMSEHLKELYVQNGIDPAIWHQSMLDLKCKAEECRNVKGIWGTFVASWFPNFYRLKRFALGRLQFELAKFESDRFVCRDGTVLTRGERVLAVHIPKSAQPLSKENCDASYQAAATFFAKEFQGGNVIFTCNSWMLYPKNSEILHEKSNTRRFGEEYEIISVTCDPPGEHPDAWRIFDVEPNGDIDSLPEDSHLRRAYKAYMQGGGITGKAYGVKLMPKRVIY
ncbi:MAG: DUF5596 domain-containing protein [Clostridia bacterium]|nr:DUF5596 domain-containing protein [Clostridia bacterium]